METEFIEDAAKLRVLIQNIGERLNGMRRDVSGNSYHLEAVSEPSEMMANLTLAYRHLEDARMRIGKAVQAFDGGKSVYPK